MPVKGDAPVLPGARAVARHVRISPNKARRVVNLVRGLPAKEALTVLQFAPQAASEQVYKVLASARTSCRCSCATATSASPQTCGRRNARGTCASARTRRACDRPCSR